MRVNHDVCFILGCTPYIS